MSLGTFTSTVLISALYSVSAIAGGLCSDVFTSRMGLGTSITAPDVHFALLPFTEKRGHAELHAVRDGKVTVLLKGKQLQNAWKDHEQILRISGDIFGIAPQTFRTGPMEYLQVFKYNSQKNEMTFFGEVPVREDAVFGKAVREVFPLSQDAFIVSDSFSNFASPHKDYLDRNPEIQFTVVEVTDGGMTRRMGSFKDTEKIAAGHPQGVRFGGMGPKEVILFDQFKVRIFRYKDQGFREDEVFSLNFAEGSGLKLNEVTFKKESESIFSIENSKGEVQRFQKFQNLYSQIGSE